MNKASLLIVTGSFLTFTASTWFVIFGYMLKYGECRLMEPCIPTLVAEIIFAAILVGLGLAVAVYGAIKLREG